MSNIPTEPDEPGHDEPSGAEILEMVVEHHKMYRWEMSTGVKNICRLVRMLGYEDPQNYGQFAHDAAYGDLFTFLEDNPGAIEALYDWISDQCETSDEWKENLKAYLPEETEDTEDTDEPDESDAQ